MPIESINDRIKDPVFDLRDFGFRNEEPDVYSLINALSWAASQEKTMMVCPATAQVLKDKILDYLSKCR